MPTTVQFNHSQTIFGIVLMCIGVACLCVNDAIAKQLNDGYSTFQILFLRNLIAFPFALAVVLKFGGRRALRSHKPVMHLLRGLIWLCAAFIFFTSLRYLELAEATALIFVAPLFITALSALLLKEHVGIWRWSAVVIGFIGVLIVVRPGAATFQAAAILPLVTALFYAILMISARWVDPRESVWTLMLYLVGAGALLSALAMPFVWSPVQSADLWLFFAIAFFGTAGMTMMTQAFRFAPASVVASLDYTAMIWATLLGWVFWMELPDTLTFVGAAIIIASGGIIILRERANAQG
ncbi:DMT family transporter [Pararhodobacter oceanensis]|uniref:EamA family transporter n=1 Tax=Pararhodobacter oceanensis TaxID=2172121 RepID=A0A2T8HX20_9RHOB|nr:DMT family transporter [Pararhodobacter oceanensis]PVH29971.1 EamA family transporter [Pararhodobacter oceanensis]